METLTEAQKAARLLGKRGGTATLKKYGPEQLREWGKLGAEHGKKGGWPKGRPRKIDNVNAERAKKR